MVVSDNLRSGITKACFCHSGDCGFPDTPTAQKASAAKVQIFASDTRPESRSPHVQISPAQPRGQLSAEQNAPDIEAASQNTSVAGAILLQNMKEQKQEINKDHLLPGADGKSRPVVESPRVGAL